MGNALLVRRRFLSRSTPHSLTVLYKVNNLVQAGRLSTNASEFGKLPSEETRLSSDEVDAYYFQRDGMVRSLINRENGFINESELGQISAELQDEMNLITSLLPE